jgi:branched-chain amino acid transport system ATP-binding protein
MLLSVKGLSAHYGRVQALSSVDIDAPEGSIVTLIGANGAGKSTFMMAVSGVLRSISGEIEYDGRRIDGLPSDEIVRLGLSQCPEGRRVWPGMTVLENLEMGAFQVGDATLVRDRLMRVYAHFPILEQRSAQLAGSLSGGEQQMLAIGRALMSGPRLLMLDEPSLGLAPIVVEHLVDIIREIRNSGTTIILVEQNAFMALGLADAAYVLETGRVALSGKASELLKNDMVRKSYLGV